MFSLKSIDKYSCVETEMKTGEFKAWRLQVQASFSPFFPQWGEETDEKKREQLEKNLQNHETIL